MTNKICLIPDNSNPYNVKMMADLAYGLRQIGFDAYHNKLPIEDKALNTFVQKNNFNIVLRINKLPPKETKRSNSFRHISWFQDVFPSLVIDDSIFQQDDLVCTLGTKETLGLKVNDDRYAGSFNLYINPDDFSQIKPKYGRQQYDANLIGFIPDVPWASKLENVVTKKSKIPISRIIHYHQIYLIRLAKIMLKGEFEKLTIEKIRDVFRKIYLGEFTFDNKERLPVDIQIARKAEQEYDILGGSLDIEQLLRSIEGVFGKDTIQENEGLVDFCVRELPRFLDRYVMALAISKVTRKLIICGNNWEFYDIFMPFLYRSVSMEESFNIFGNSKLTLQNNNHGIGMHSRTLSAMAAGGFIFTHNSPRDELPGGMKIAFEPGVHYGSFDLENITEETQRWLSSNKERDEIAERARQYVLSEMHWVNGAKHLAEKINLQP